MKRVLIIGASGNAGRASLDFLKDVDNLELTLVSRSMSDDFYPQVSAKRVALDATDAKSLADLAANQDMILAFANGDALANAKALLEALVISQSSARIIWLTGMGIHAEVSGEKAAFYEGFVKMMPTYVEAADLIAASNHPSVLLRAPKIVKENWTDYILSQEGQVITNYKISYQAIGKFAYDVITDQVTLSDKESLGITGI